MSDFAGRFNGWVEDFTKSGSPFHSSVSQINRLVALFPEIEASDARIVRTDKFIGAYATLKTANSRCLLLVI